MRWITLVPNSLSALRLMLAAAFPFVPMTWCAAVIVVAGLSDFVDGWFARRFHATSWIGGLLDAVSDKAFTLAVLVTFTLGAHLAWWQFVLLIVRDIVVALIALYAAATRQWSAFKRMPSRWAGKVTTALMFVLMVVIAMETPGLPLVLFALTALCSVAAGVDYFGRFVEVRRDAANRPVEDTGEQTDA